MRNFVAKNMNQFNRASVVPNKRNKMLDDLWEKEEVERLVQQDDGEEDAE